MDLSFVLVIAVAPASFTLGMSSLVWVYWNELRRVNTPMAATSTTPST